MGRAHQPGLTSGHLRTHLLDDPGHHHEVCLQPAGQRADTQVSDSPSGLFVFTNWVGLTCEAAQAAWMVTSTKSKILSRMTTDKSQSKPTVTQPQIPDPWYREKPVHVPY